MEPHTPQPKLSETILKRIEAGEATPRSRTYFVLRNVALWSAALLALLIGALAVSTIIFRINNFSRALPPPEEVRFFYEFVRLLPFLWLLVLALFGYIAYKEFRHTRQGYKYELSTVLLGLVVVSGILGASLYAAGSGYALDTAAGRFVPFHPAVETLQRERWLRPENGLLVGEVTARMSDGFTLTDPEETVWRVVLLTGDEELIGTIEPGTHIGVRGVVRDSEAHVFVGCHFRVLELRGRGVFIERRHAPLGEPKPKGADERNASTTRTSECEGVRPLSNN